MDDSDQDFVDLCSKLLKRVRKKPGEPRQPRRAEHPPSSQTGNGDKRTRNNRRDGGSVSKSAAAVGGTQPVCPEAEQLVVSRRVDAGSSVSTHSVVSAAAAGLTAERGLRPKDKVLIRMQQFRRDSPQKLLHKYKSQSTGRENECDPAPPPAEKPGDTKISSMLHLTKKAAGIKNCFLSPIFREA